MPAKLTGKSSFEHHRSGRRRARCAYAPIFCACLLIVVSSANADEGGTTQYYTGLSDVLAGWLPEAGTCFLSRLFYLDKHAADLEMSGTASSRATATAVVQLLTLTHVTPYTLFGGAYGVSATLPAAHASALAQLDAISPGIAVSDEDEGFGDLIVAPAVLGWKNGKLAWNLATAVYAPTGKYDPKRLVSIGRNVWAIEENLGLTWLNPENGAEVSLSPGITVQFENEETNYTSAPELHIDFALAQHFNEQLAVGAGGYFLEQLGDDSGPGVETPGGRLLGVGPLVVYNAAVAGSRLTLTWKLYADVESKHLLHGTTAWFGLDFGL